MVDSIFNQKSKLQSLQSGKAPSIKAFCLMERHTCLLYVESKMNFDKWPYFPALIKINNSLTTDKNVFHYIMFRWNNLKFSLKPSFLNRMTKFMIFLLRELIIQHYSGLYGFHFCTSFTVKNDRYGLSHYKGGQKFNWLSLLWREKELLEADHGVRPWKVSTVGTCIRHCESWENILG